MVVKMRSIAIAAAVISSFAVSENLGAAACPTNIINYQASGTFGPNPISGPDKFKLEGEPFSISVKVCSNKVPTQKGSDYAAYSPLELTGMVKSGLTEQNTPIESKNTTAILVQPATGVDTIQLSGIVVLEGAEISIHANIALPAGTLTSTNIAPFPSASIIPAKSEFTYVVTHGPWQASTVYALGNEILDPSGNIEEVTTAGTSGTTAPAWNKTVGGTTTDNTVVWTNEGPLVLTALSVSGTTSATIYTSSATQANVVLHSDAVQVITAHANGTQSVRPMQAAPVDLGAPSDRVMLHFYASGVRDASEAVSYTHLLVLKGLFRPARAACGGR